MKGVFDQWVRYKVRDGQCIKFWHNEWCGQQVLSQQFPNLYLLDRQQHAFIAEQFEFMGGSVAWNFCLRRNLTDLEKSDLCRMFGFLDKVSVKCLYNVLIVNFGTSDDWRRTTFCLEF